MRQEKPDWARGDTLRSIRDVVAIGAAALKEVCLDAAAWADTKLANAINSDEDEN